MLQFVPQRVVEVQCADRPLEGGPYPKFGGKAGTTRDRIVHRFNAKALAGCGQPFQGQSHRKVVVVVAVNVDVIFKQHEVRAHQELTREGALVPRLVGRSVVAG